uniref:Basement membrane-specific heparan sulfate proteoglycan core protein n=1 Tax=Esox lucius TaxID=8010 RepID=A0A6Q2XIM3_ESOLU
SMYSVTLVLLYCQCYRCLFPAVLNLASMAEIRTNATCGESGPEMYCKLVEHVPGQQVRNTQCRICNNNSERPFERHPIEYAIDGTNRWWQSPSIKNGMDYHYVTITLDLQQVFQIAYIILKAANSPRPGNWVLERSLDGVTFTPWQYYAITDTECLTRFNILPRTGPPSYTRDDEVICTSFYSKIQPLENGEIHTSLINGRPSADDPSPTLLNFTSARYIRLQFQRIRTLNADLMTLAFNDPRDVDPIVTRRYFYSIKDISVGGMCICYGHAKACPLNIQTKKFSCECEHNTCGESCDHCCPGHNQKPWMAGTFLTRHVCEKCNCHGKSEECYFNQTVADIKQSLNTKGEYLGGGVCVGCVRNTAGVNCQTCTEGYYRPRGVSPTDFDPCRPCFCDKSGSLSPACVPDQSQAEGDLTAGSCRCKQGYGGLRCDRCAFGYSGFPDCVRCTCSLDGSQNKDPCQLPCVCKENVEGENCDRCKTGFYHLLGEHLHGCEKCYCSGVASDCSDSHKAYSNVRHNTSMAGWFLTAEDGEGKVWPDTSRDKDGPWTLSVNNQEARRHLPSVYYWRAPGEYLGNKLTSFGGSLVYTVSYDAGEKDEDIRVNSAPNVIIEVSATPNQRTGLPVSKRDFMIALTNVSSLLIRASHSNEQVAIYRLHSVSLEVASEVSRGENLASAVEICRCPPGYSGTSCEMCSVGHRRVNGTAFKGVCEPCDCHGHTTRCDDHTGQCMGCAEHTTGFHCHECIPGFYGDATKGTANDCQPCACPLNIPSNNFSPTCHEDLSGELLCDQCPPGYTGPRCDRCTNGYFGQPGIRGGSCQPCRCNANLDLALPQSCDPITGSCLRCKDGYAGSTCDICAEGFFGDAIEAKNCQRECCHQNGSVSEVCHRENGQCQCKLHVVGRQCDECMPQTYGIQSAGGCVPCNCNSFGSKSFDCDASGQCRCQPGVSGPKCDRCAPGHFNFQEGGCTPCQCAHVGDNCDVNTGQCVCPPNTVGERCDKCAPNHWGHDITTGCKACGCNPLGSVTQQCNPNTGCCMCREKFHGEKCSECKLGYRDFPQCISCDCNVAGSDSQTCDAERDVCACADRTGKCSCKENTQGLHCDQCKAGTFGLSTRNPQGCSRCYCFGMSSTCSEAPGLIRMWVSPQTKLPLVDQDNQRETTRGVTFQHPEIVVKAELVNQMLTEPYYWRLPEQFTGSMITAYGGKLKYAIYFEGRDETGSTSYEPQVIIKGGPNRDKGEVNDKLTPTLLRTGLVPQHEWKYEDRRAMTREDFMDVLFYVDYVLIKASHGNMMRHSRLALLTVCQNQLISECGAGFYRLSARGGGAASRAGIGSCVQCQCNGHSGACDPDTSICQNCQHNTEGDRCERCAPGYYGVVRGRPDDCKRCACPLVSPENNFSPSCVTVGFHDYRCTACPDGYEGQHCERCATGYHGDPRAPGGKCEECKCDLYGAWPQPCDPGSGQCRCRPGASGRTCSQCMERHVSCDDDCSGLLISDMDRLHRIITSVNLTTPLPPPYKVLYRFENMTEELKSCKKKEGHLVADLIHSQRTGRPSSVLLTPYSTLMGPFPAPSRLAEALYQKVKRIFGDPHQATEDLKAEVTEKMDDHRAKLDDAQALLKDAQGKIREAGVLSGQNQRNITALEVSSLYRIITIHFPFTGFDHVGLGVSVHTHRFVHAAGAKVKDLEDEADRLLEKLKPIKELQDNLKKNISQIKELINQARKQANSIKVSVSSGGDCIRAYRPDIKKGSYNTIVLNVKTTSPDNLLFYLGSIDFLALEMRKGKVSFLWDVGSGVGKVEHADVTMHDGNWHRIEASNGINGTISVYAMEGPRAGIMPTSKSGTSPAGYTILDVDQNAYLFVGGILGSVKKADAVKTSTFSGCMGEAYLDNKPIGLWNYREREGDCKGCVVSPQPSDTEGTVQFDGEGYAAVSRPTRWNPNVSTIMFKFRSFSTDSLLMYFATKDMDFMSAELSDGRVKVSFDLGSGTGSDISTKRHNDGRWKSFTLTRQIFHNERRGKSEWQLRRLSSLHRSEVFKKRYAGCMRDIEVSRTPYNLLSSFDYTGLTKGCSVEVSLSSTGFIGTRLISVNIILNQRFCECVFFRLIMEFELRTTAESGLVFYMARINHADFATVQVKEGMAHLGYDLGHGNTSVSVPRIINDGHWHKVIAYTRRRGVLVIDNRYSKHTISPKKADILDVVGMLYIGGLPVNYTTKRIGPVLYSIDGCIRNFKMLGSVLDMDKPTSSHHVGSCFVSTEKGTYFDGTGYIKAGELVGLDVGLELEFRTAQSNGVLLGVSSQVDNKMKGLGIELHNGKLLFHVDNGAGRITAQYEPEAEAGLCDGRWHSVTAHKLRHRLELVVDGRKVEAESPNARFNTVDTSDPIYVGGYPEGLKQFGLITSTSFKGCMRDLKITKAAKVFEVQFNKGLEFKGVQPLTCPATTA